MDNIIPKYKKFCTYLKPLVAEVKSMKDDYLSEFNKELVEKILREQDELKEYILEYSDLIQKYTDDEETEGENEEDENDENSEKKEELMLLYKILIAYFERNQRGLLIYSFHRNNRIKQFFWKYQRIPEEFEDHMSKKEKKSFNRYRKNLNNIFPEEIGLNKHVSGKPPVCDTFILGQVNKEMGMVETLEGSYFLKKGALMNIRRDEGSDFLKQGLMKEVQI